MKRGALAVALGCALGLLIFVFAAESKAQVSDILTVSETVICTSVVDRVPADTDTVFADTVGVVYCFTKIERVKTPTTISHVWYY